MHIHRALLSGALIAVVVAVTAWGLPASGSGASAPATDSSTPRAGSRAEVEATVLDMAQLMATGEDTSVDPGPPPGAKVMVVAGRGYGKNTSQDPSRTQFEVPLYDVLTGEKVGRSTHDFICDGFFSCDDIDTYYLPGGTIRSPARVSFNNDGQRPGFVLVGAFPKPRKLEGTGVYAGKQGSVRVNGWALVEEFPLAMTLDEIYVITYW